MTLHVSDGVAAHPVSDDTEQMPALSVQAHLGCYREAFLKPA